MKAFKAQFGGKPRKDDIQRYEKSPNWNAGKFQNLEETTMAINLKELPKLLKQNFSDKAIRRPQQVLPVKKLDIDAFLENDGRARFVWYGHSVLLIQIAGKIILIDPMLGPNASPIAPFSTDRFSDHTLDLIDDFPDIDLVLLTHDHYDHLDMASIMKLKSKVKNWWTALGVSRHLEYWGIAKEKVKPFDWWEQAEFEGLQITFTPSRHFSGRGVLDRAKSLWGGWVIKSEMENIYWSGDGGRGDHFHEVGEKLGPFDIGFMECGQYHQQWHDIHMFPEESVHAALDAGVKIAVPVHWGGFSLALHHWKEPVERFQTAAVTNELKCFFPKLGEVFTKDFTLGKNPWWSREK
ncbi:MBL fold metallo-hydrolase [Persicobacter sp. CCB-QB2]|uniref:MBL fold metallo-hydrolase n=1 Tax=Persicobacter sp. CCB-QB2 TaxID=1561025 RepID=UPI0006A9DB7F|nr:MBL fold metallo-hydrolase [Persicobacter sp. CCB-QB2]